MSAMLAGVGAVSSAITNSPAFSACCSAVFTALPLVVMRMPLSPSEIALSIAVIWVCVSPSELPAATVSLTPSLAASASASFFIVTKYGLVSVLRMRDTPTVWPLADADPLEAGLLEEPCEAAELEELEELHAAGAAYIARRTDRRRAAPVIALFVELSMLLTPLRSWPRIDAQILDGGTE